MIAVPVIVIAAVIGAVSDSGKNKTPAPPSKKNPIDEYMDENYGDIDWLRKGKL